MMLAGQPGAPRQLVVEWKDTSAVLARIAPGRSRRGSLRTRAVWLAMSEQERSARLAARVGDLRRLARKYAALARSAQIPLSAELALVG